MPWSAASISTTMAVGHEPGGYCEAATSSTHLPRNGSLAALAPDTMIAIATIHVIVRSPAGLQCHQEVEDRLLVGFRQKVEALDHGIGFGGSVGEGVCVLRRIVAAIGEASREMILNRHAEITRPSVVEEEQALPEPPERCRAEFVRPGIALDD